MLTETVFEIKLNWYSFIDKIIQLNDSAHGTDAQIHTLSRFECYDNGDHMSMEIK